MNGTEVTQAPAMIGTVAMCAPVQADSHTPITTTNGTVTTYNARVQPSGMMIIEAPEANRVQRLFNRSQIGNRRAMGNFLPMTRLS